MADFFTNKLALITGGSSGIGRSLALLLARGGADVFVLARTPDRLRDVVRELEANCVRENQRFGMLPCDVTSPKEVDRCIAELYDRACAPDLLINSAGAAMPGYVEELDLSVFHEMMDANYFGTVNTVKAVLPAMLQRGSGTIVNVASLAALIGAFGYTAYGASKYAVRGFSDVLRAELKPRGINVHIVYPPDTDTPQLAYESQFKPPETKALTGSASIQSPDAVAQAMLKGIEKGRYSIVIGFEGQWIKRLSGWVGDGVYPIVDWMIGKARNGKGPRVN